MSNLYLYPAWVRLWHWTNAALFLVLIATGVSMHYAGAPGLIPFRLAVPMHNTAGVLLSLAWIGFVVANARSPNARHYRIYWRSLIGDLITQSRYYAWGIFRGEPHPFHVSAERKFNALQTLSYLGAMYLLLPLLVLSGWGFLLAPWLPETLNGVVTLWLVAMLHLASSYLLVLFLLVHLYIITIGESVFTNLRAMITGWHRDHSTDA